MLLYFVDFFLYLCCDSLTNVQMLILVWQEASCLRACLTMKKISSLWVPPLDTSYRVYRCTSDARGPERTAACLNVNYREVQQVPPTEWEAQQECVQCHWATVERQDLGLLHRASWRQRWLWPARLTAARSLRRLRARWAFFFFFKCDTKKKQTKNIICATFVCTFHRNGFIFCFFSVTVVRALQ